MWPWGHLAVGYLLFSTAVRLRFDRAPRDAPTFALALGTQFPDLVDKPLAWTFGVLPNGRSLAHSLVIAVPAIVALWLVLRRRRRASVANAFGLGYFSHLATDAMFPALAGDYYYLGFLAWPIVPAIDYGEEGFLVHFRSLELTSFTGLELLLGGLVVALWYRDGAPGLATVRSAFRWAHWKVSRSS